MRRTLILPFLFLALSTNAQRTIPVSKPVSAASPASVAMSPERLARIDAAADQWVRDGYTNGCVALILRDGKIVYHKAFGYNDADKKQPLKADDIFRIASQSKAITSVAAMMLYEEGKFQLDDPISKYIPEFKNQQVLDKFNDKDTTYTTVPAKSDITVRQLLTHTSGLGYAQIGTPEAQAMYSKERITAGLGIPGHRLGTDMKKLGKLPLLNQPGDQWMYSLGDDVLGHVIEVVSGMPLDQFMRKRIFDPLGMRDTWFYLPRDKYERLVTLYAHDSTGMRPYKKEYILGEQVDPDYPKRDFGYFSGGGGLSSTVKDYAIFLQMLLNGGVYNGKRLLSKSTVRMMTSDQFQNDKSGKMTPFGLGFGITTLAGSAGTPQNEGTFAWGGAFGTMYWGDPKEKIVALLYFNKLPLLINAGDVFPVLVYQGLD